MSTETEFKFILDKEDFDKVLADIAVQLLLR